VSPQYLRVGSVALALLSLTFLAIAVRQWTSSRDQRGITALTAPGSWSGNLIIFTVALVAVGGLIAAAAVFGWPRDRTLWIGIGTLLGLMTLSRPWWFWENWKARFLRNLIGDAATAAVYLAIAGVMIWIGLATDWKFGRQ
jgi:hypothetical protein